MKLTGQCHILATLSSSSREVKHNTHLKGGRVWAVLDVVERMKPLALVANRKRFLGRPARSLVTQPSYVTLVTQEINAIMFNEILINKQNKRFLALYCGKQVP
jgi:hypothetical protein